MRDHRRARSQEKTLISFLLEHFLLSGSGVLAIAAFVVVAIYFPLLVNRYTIGALIAVLVVVGIAMGYTALREDWMAEGAKAKEEQDRAAQVERKKTNEAFAQDISDIVKESQDRLAASRELLERARKERKSNVSSTADRACPITRGFVHDHDRDVPGAAGRAEVPIAATDVDKPAAGVVLSRIGSCVGSNYTECALVAERLAICESARYNACIAWDKRYGTKSNCTR